MNQHDDINDDDDFEIINGRKVLKDGRTFRTRINVMDAQGHRPGFVTDDDDDARDAADESRDEYIRYLQDAHRQPHADTDEPYRPTSLADAKRAADEAREERDQWLRDAWKGTQP